MALVKAYRTHGHLAARLDPLGSEPVGDPSLEPERLEPKLTPELQRLIPADILRVHVPGETLADVLPRLRETYCGTSAYEIEHISDHEQRVWLRSAIESGRYRRPLAADEKRRLLERLTEVEGFERYLRRAFLGQKQFSIEGLDVMIPMLDEAIELGRRGRRARGRARHGASRAAQRPRARARPPVRDDPAGVRGRADARGGRLRPRRRHRRRQVPPRRARAPRPTPSGDITLTLASNPSHLEAVDPVVEGTHARRADRPLEPHRLPRLVGRDADPDPRRRGLPGAGRRRRDAEPRRPGRLLDRRLAAPDREQPDRLHHRSGRRALDALLERPRQGLRSSDHPRQRRRSRGRARPRSGSPSPSGAASAPTSSSTSSATAGTATTSRTRLPTRNR